MTDKVHTEELIPFTWEAWDEQDVLALTFYNVQFVEDFGPIKAGEKFDSIFIDYGKCILETYERDEEMQDLKPTNTIKIKAIAI